MIDGKHVAATQLCSQWQEIDGVLTLQVATGLPGQFHVAQIYPCFAGPLNMGWVWVTETHRARWPDRDLSRVKYHAGFHLLGLD